MSDRLDQVRALYASTLQPRIDALDGVRRELKTYIMTSLFWLWRVRRVAIQPDAILIWRGLRPFAKRYRRPEWGRVLRIDNAIYIGRSADRGLINPTASPMLASVDEAKWVASEIQKALRR